MYFWLIKFEPNHKYNLRKMISLTVTVESIFYVSVNYCVQCERDTLQKQWQREKTERKYYCLMFDSGYWIPHKSAETTRLIWTTINRLTDRIISRIPQRLRCNLTALSDQCALCHTHRFCTLVFRWTSPCMFHKWTFRALYSLWTVTIGCCPSWGRDLESKAPPPTPPPQRHH